MRTTCLQTPKLILVAENEMNLSINITLRVLGFHSRLPHLTQQELQFGRARIPCFTNQAFFIGCLRRDLPSKLTHPSKYILAHPGELICLCCLGKICSFTCVNSQPTTKCHWIELGSIWLQPNWVLVPKSSSTILDWASDSRIKQTLQQICLCPLWAIKAIDRLRVPLEHGDFRGIIHEFTGIISLSQEKHRKQKNSHIPKGASR